MSIRLKMILTYVGIILLSLMVIVGGMLRTTAQFMSDVSENVVGDHTFEEIMTAVINNLVDIEYMVRYESDLLEDEDHMKAVEGVISAYNLAMFVEVDNEFVYNSVNSPTVSLTSFVDKLEFDEGHSMRGSDKGHIDTADYTDDDGVFYVVFRRAIDVKNQGEDYVYMVYNGNNKVDFAWSMYGGIYRFIIFIVILIVVLMSVVVSKTIIKPLNKLEDATIAIKNGNLDFSIQSKKKDEFGRVMNAFDNMREELKNSINQQLLVEENRKELITSISHDLKTPITSIKGYVEGIRDGVASDEEKMAEYLEVIHTKSIDLDRLIDDLFLFSKLDLKRLPFDFQNIPAKLFFGDSEDEIKMDLVKQGFEINFVNELSDTTLICVDQQQFKRVMMNIINNAVKYSNEKKQIDLHISETVSSVNICIRDYGKGISREALDKIFDKFYRADPSRNADIGGSGLGLAIAKQIIDSHEGTIDAESTLGEGTTITMTLGKVQP